MPVSLRLFVVALALLLGGPVWAQQPKGWLGVDLQDVSKEDAAKLGWDEPRGVKVIKPREGGPAAAAGILADDIIVILDGLEVDNMERFIARIGDRNAGAQVRLRLLRAGKERTITATLGQRPAELTQVAPVKRDLPILQLDTGGHRGVIKGLAFTPDGKHVISAGNDKVIRVWDWETGKTVRTIRGEAGPGSEGKIFSMALSPDGRWLAAGGWMKVPDEAGHTVRLHDFASGNIVALLKGQSNGANSLAFSPDGKRLISGGFFGEAMLWDIERRALAHPLKGHTDHIYSAGFTPDGAYAVTGSLDTQLKLWSVKDGKEFATLTGHKDKIFAIAVSPTAGLIASSSDDGEIRLWNAKTGGYLRTLGTADSWVGMLVFSPDGKRLVSTCGGGAACNLQPQIVWDVASGRRLQQPKHHDNIVIAAAASPIGGLVATGGFNGDVQVWDIETGETKRVLVGGGKPVWGAVFSADGRRVGWGNTYKAGWKVNDYSEPAFEVLLPGSGQVLGRPGSLGSAAASAFVRARTTHAAYGLAHRTGRDPAQNAVLELMKDGKVEATIERGSADGYQHRSYTFSPDGRSIISGGDNGVLIAYDLKGNSLGEFIGHESEVWAVTPSPDGRLLVTGSADQTVRLWNLKTRELIVTLFYGSDGEWVMWTPQGYYTGSPGADRSVGWQVNKGPQSAADYVGADQLRQHLNRPDIVEKAIILASADQAVAESPGTSFKLADLLAKPVPKFRIVSPLSGSTERGGRTPIKIDVEPVPNPIKTIRVQVNGRLVEELTPPIGSGGFSPGERILNVPLSKGRNDVRITLTNDSGDKAETVTITHQGEGDLDKRGTLYILAIGVDRYPSLGQTCGRNGDVSCDLRYSGADARRLVEAAERRLGPSHTKVVKRVLVNGASASDAPTASNIIDATDLLKQAKETDTVLLFIAGHGVNDGPNYRFLATNAERAGDTYRNVTVVPWQFLQEAVESAKGRRVLFIDTCHSGNAYNQKLGNTAFHANIIAYTSARFDQEAMEDSDLGHGLFTYAVVEGLEGKGAMAARREISTKELAEYVVKRVEELAKSLKGEQEPQYFKGRDAEDYVLARW
jgi:WD40 repeat protein